MGEEAPCSVVPRRAAAAMHFRLPRHGLRRKVLIVRLGGSAGGGAARAGGNRRIKLRRWFRRAMWTLAELCVAALSGPPAPGKPPSDSSPWMGVEPCFAAPFVPAVLIRRAGQYAS